MIPVLGLDIGGANLKAAFPSGPAVSRPFALWKNPSGLTTALAELLAGLPKAQRLAVTMTGELCDCYPTRSAGVVAILDALADAAGRIPVRVWTTEGFMGPETARSAPLTTASANWLALATFAGRFAAHGPAMLIDIGTTTTDIIPLVDGNPRPVGRTDKERLESGELVYRGWRRTPLSVLGNGMAELFATTQDLCLLLGLIAEDEGDRDTADGRPATITAAHARVARMRGADVDTSTEAERLEYIREMQTRLLGDIAAGCDRVAGSLPGSVKCVLLAGSGEFLARRLLAPGDIVYSPSIISLNEELGCDRSTAACAYAVAVLNQEREGVP